MPIDEEELQKKVDIKKIIETIESVYKDNPREDNAENMFKKILEQLKITNVNYDSVEYEKPTEEVKEQINNELTLYKYINDDADDADDAINYINLILNYYNPQQAASFPFKHVQQLMDEDPELKEMLAAAPQNEFNALVATIVSNRKSRVSPETTELLSQLAKQGIPKDIPKVILDAINKELAELVKEGADERRIQKAETKLRQLIEEQGPLTLPDSNSPQRRPSPRRPAPPAPGRDEEDELLAGVRKRQETRKQTLAQPLHRSTRDLLPPFTEERRPVKDVEAAKRRDARGWIERKAQEASIREAEEKRKAASIANRIGVDFKFIKKLFESSRTKYLMNQLTKGRRVLSRSVLNEIKGAAEQLEANSSERGVDAAVLLLKELSYAGPAGADSTPLPPPPPTPSQHAPSAEEPAPLPTEWLKGEKMPPASGKSFGAKAAAQREAERVPSEPALWEDPDALARMARGSSRKGGTLKRRKPKKKFSRKNIIKLLETQ